MDDGLDGDHSATTEGHHHHHRGTSRFNHHQHQYRTQHLRHQHQHQHPNPRFEHEHDSGTDDNDQLSADEYTTVHIGEEGSLHHRHHPSADGVVGAFPEHYHRPPPPMLRPDDDDYPLHHRARASSPPPPPPPPPPNNYSPGGRNGRGGTSEEDGYRERQPKFNSPYRRAARDLSSPGPRGGGHHPMPGGGQHMPYAPHPPPPHRRGRKWSVAFLLRCGGAACALAYLAVVLRSKALLDQWAGGRVDSDGDQADGASPPGSAKAGPRPRDDGGAEGGFVEVKSAAAERAREWNEGERRRAAGDAARRRELRRRRARPPPPRVDAGAGGGDAAGGPSRHLARYDFSLLDERWAGAPPASSPDLAASDAPPLPDGAPVATAAAAAAASAEQLCGAEARNASLRFPGSYLVRDALGPQSRVLITGILGPVGFHLALALRERCGVKTIMGIDPMFPNTAPRRLELQRRIAILTKAIPGLGQPVMLPYVGLDPRLSPKKAAEAAKAGGSLLLPGTGELNFLTFRPTHIVHLASASPDAYRDAEGLRGGKANDNSPYCGASPSSPDGDGAPPRAPPLFEIRQAAAGMEHLLTSVGNAAADDDSSAAADAAATEGGGSSSSARPHVTYASHAGIYGAMRTGVRQRGREAEDFHPATKLVDEVLAGTYGALHGVYAVGLRLADVYGPWGARGSRMHDLTEEAVRRWGVHPEGEGADAADAAAGDAGGGGGPSFGRLRDVAAVGDAIGNAEADTLFVDDAVKAIIAAMQYRKEGSSSAVFDVTSGERTSLFQTADMLEALMPGGESQEAKLGLATSDVRSTEASRLAEERLGWSAETSLREGIVRTAAWHLDRRLPFGPAPAAPDRPPAAAAAAPAAVEETGDALLLRRGLEPCGADDAACLRGRRRFPCASECGGGDTAYASTCTPSPFDSIAVVSRELTDGCDVVLYTSSLGYDVQDINLKATYEDPEEGEPEVCNVAFVPRDCALVRKAIRKVPESSLKNVGVVEEGGIVDVERRLAALNGRILHKGWVLVWVSDATGELPPEVVTLPKMSPGKLFAPSAQRVMFVDENFTVTPNTEDVLFLASEMDRKALPDRTFVRKDENEKKHKYLLPAEPRRRAVILFNTMKQRKPKDDKARQAGPVPKAQKISVYDAVKYMVFEVGGDPNQSDPKPLKQQREFYERVPTFVNRDDLRSIYEPVHRYDMRHWVRSRWVLHDLELQEGRQLRCEWYEEHLLWGNDLDQLSFAHVLARREVERKFARDEPDDHVRAAAPKHPELEGMSDAAEWHQVLRTDEAPESRGGDPVFRTMEKVPEHMFDPEEEEEGEKEAEEDGADGGEKKAEAVDLFARIMSDKVMLMSRKVWQK